MRANIERHSYGPKRANSFKTNEIQKGILRLISDLLATYHGRIESMKDHASSSRMVFNSP